MTSRIILNDKILNLIANLTTFCTIVLIRPHKEQYDDKDWCISALQDKAVQEV